MCGGECVLVWCQNCVRVEGWDIYLGKYNVIIVIVVDIRIIYLLSFIFVL